MTQPSAIEREGSSPRTSVIDEFRRCFGESPALVVRAPGRVNLIGDHTDYNDGFVLPMAIDRAVWIALRPREDQRVVVRSLDMDESVELELQAFDRRPGEGGGWVEYIRGVAWALAAAGYRERGWDGVVAGDVPLGAGLSSSAALELATARAFCAAGGWTWEPVNMARVAQRAEREWVGVNCGIMDPGNSSGKKSFARELAARLELRRNREGATQSRHGPAAGRRTRAAAAGAQHPAGRSGSCAQVPGDGAGTREMAPVRRAIDFHPRAPGAIPGLGHQPALGPVADQSGFDSDL